LECGGLACLPQAGRRFSGLQRYRKLIRVLTDRQPTSGTAIFGCAHFPI